MKYPKIPLAQTIVQLCRLYDLDRVVISPGSRNAPLTLGFSNDDFFKSYSIVDERCAGFFALGLAQQLKKPVLLVCTSGSALLNYFPAIAEAYYSQIPLLVLSADRPEHLIGIGDGQTINQTNVYGNHILFSSNLKLDIDPNNISAEENDLPIFKSIENKLERFIEIQKDIQKQNEIAINDAIQIALTQMGPTHLNVPFDEPLYGEIDMLLVRPEKSFNTPNTRDEIDTVKLGELVASWNSAAKKMILVGVLDPETLDLDQFLSFIKDPSVLILTETTSNLHHPLIFESIDKLIDSLDENALIALQPEILMTIGGMVVSKKIKRFLRTYQPKQHWHLGTNRANDTYYRLNEHIKINPNIFLGSFGSKISVCESTYFENWASIKAERNVKHREFLNKTVYSDLKVFETILSTIPNQTILQLSNSSVIRYTQLFRLNSTLNVFCNRGTSGIDGSTSTAIGCAVANKKPTLLITGDLSFLYDSNALWNAAIPNSFRIIVVNNGGGGIFRIISPNKDSDKFSEYFETNHSYTAEHLCSMFSFHYTQANNLKTLNEALEEFYNTSDRPQLLEIFTPRKLNEEILKNYFKYLS